MAQPQPPLPQKMEELQNLLDSIPGVTKAYFQPAEDITMVHPCIVYERDYAETTFANNLPYRHTKRYQVTIISRDPDDPISDYVAALPMCLFVRHFTEDGLHHDIYNLYY